VKFVVNNKQYWRSLEELAQTEEFQRLVENEFAVSPLDGQNEFSRRRFLQLMGASMALAGLTACTRQPEEKIFPYVRPPEEIIPGKPLFYATAMSRGGYAYGVLAESHLGRPTKIEGNPDHPASLGATDIFAQASILELYDPDRSQVVTHLGRISTWENFLNALQVELEAQKLTDGAGLRILTETITSPTFANQLQTLLAEFPLAKWHQYEPVNRDHAKAGAKMVFGEFVETRYDFARADCILSLDADFLTGNPGSLKYTRDFTARRKVDETRATMNRLYVVESTPSLTGAMADHRLPLAASEIAAFAAALAQELEVTSDLGITIENSPSLANVNWGNWMKAVAKDLRRYRGARLVIAGESQPPVVHALAHIINFALGNVGKTVIHTDPVEAQPVIQTDSLRELVNDMRSGAVEMLVVIGGNPVFNAPADFDFLEAMKKVKFRVHLNLYDDETSEWCHWHIPQAHCLESWSDARAFDGTASIIQPLIAPLYGGKSAHEFLAVFLGQAGKSGHDIVRDYWKTRYPLADFEKFWRTSLHDGLVAGTAFSPKSVQLKIEDRRWRIEDRRSRSSIFDPQSSETHEVPQNLEIIFRPDPTIWDGRYANNGWLQELPKPLTKLTWDNAALVSPKTAEALDVKNEDVVELTYRDRRVQGPIWITPGLPENSVTVHVGYGRKRAGNVGSRTGFNAYAIRTSAAPWFDRGLQIRKTGARYALASTQMHHNMENRHLVRTGTLAEYLEHPEFVHELGHEPAPELTLYPPFKYEGYSWGMAVDLNSCIGCNACTIACQAENNIPVVGKEQVLTGREMHWIRIDHYFEGDADNPESVHQPVMCQHCENAPCEVVCPVAATTHSAEGLNEMVYNRCVGTRYCANNCPYKVRRFNFLLYSDFETPSLKMMRNPDVTVRSRGVMEKCTYCVQRINAARIDAKNEDREIRDGEILTACQQVCPADAIVFGNINDPNSRVSKLKAEPRNYGILTDLNTRPRTSYLAKIRNPNPELAEA
jgi:molybdopterin-containing oxidoreductase family iron-sulfur binding subunit